MRVSAKSEWCEGRAEHLGTVWLTLRPSIRSVHEEVSLANLVAGNIPAPVDALAKRNTGSPPSV